MEWAGLARTVFQRARRLGHVVRFARYAQAEDQRHELPSAVFGCEKGPRPAPYIFSADDIQRLVLAAFQSGCRSLRRDTYGTLFALLACTGLRVSEAIRLRYDDIIPDGLLIRCSKFRKSRLVPLHHMAQAGLERYLERRRPYAPFDDHVFVSLRRKPLLVRDVETAFHTAVTKLGLPCESRRPRPTVHSLRHTFAVRALESCPDGRDHITQHILSLSTSRPQQRRPHLLVSRSNARVDERYFRTLRALCHGGAVMTPHRTAHHSLSSTRSASRAKCQRKHLRVIRLCFHAALQICCEQSQGFAITVTT